MSNIIKAQKGTKDILPQEIEQWQNLEAKASEVFSSAGFKEIRTPIFEATELFARGVGDTTDIVNKEMYTFEKSERSLTLRPENTAGVVRAYIENGMHRLSAPVKLWYKGPMFRYERPQAGRQRRFHQVGVEA
jgi:histidyl-tRNA synthetase